MSNENVNPEIEISQYEDDIDVFNFGRALGVSWQNGQKLPEFELSIGIRKGLVVAAGVAIGAFSGLAGKDGS